jgi:Arc-like DNA binding domain
MLNFSVRLPEELHGRIKAAAEHERRSMHAEILCLLERGVGTSATDTGVGPEAAQPAAVLTAYRTRSHGRRVLVISDLADLRGPATGKVILPLLLYWSPAGRVFDLTDPWSHQEMYRIVLTEAIRNDDLTTWLNGPRLVETWQDLRAWLPKGVRQAWEEVHPVLADIAEEAGVA